MLRNPDGTPCQTCRHIRDTIVSATSVSRRVILAALPGLVLPALVTPSEAQLFGGGYLNTGSPPTYPTYDSTSFWYNQIPTDVTLNTNSANLTDTFVAQVGSGVGTNIYSYTAPLWNPGSSVPSLAVTAFDCFDQGFIYPPGLPAAWDSVPFPQYAGPSAGTDSEMILYDVTTDTLYEFWQLFNVASGWEACAGGSTSGMSTNPGYWSGGYGITATGLNYSGGQIRVAELQAGAINHVMGLAPTATETYTIFSWPAQRSDGYNPDGLPNQIPEGLRCRLDPTINVPGLGLNPLATTIAYAAQTYGFVVWDKTSSTPSIRFENAASYTSLGLDDPYPALLNGIEPYAILDGFPWSSLQWMPMNYGEP